MKLMSLYNTIKYILDGKNGDPELPGGNLKSSNTTLKLELYTEQLCYYDSSSKDAMSSVEVRPKF